MTSPISESKLGSSSEMDGCIVCGVLDTRVSRCCGAECVVWFHGECLVESGGTDDPSDPFCPYCRFMFLSMKSKSLREEAIQAEKAMLKYREKPNMILKNDGTDSKSVDMEEDEVVASGEEESRSKEEHVMEKDF